MKILAVGGGSGGHVTPVVPVLDELAQQVDDISVRFVCDVAFEDEARKLIARASVPVQVSVIQAGKLRRYKNFTFLDYVKKPSIWLNNLLDVGKIIVGFSQSIALMITSRPDVVFAKGGYVSLPLGLAAWCLRVPLVVHDSDVRPGLTNRILSHFARAIATGYPLENYPYNKQISTYTGVPTQASYAPVDTDRQASLKKKYGFSEKLPLVVAFGGGLGAKSINEAVLAATHHTDIKTQYLLVTGRENFVATQNKMKKNLPHVFLKDFIATGFDEMLAAADIVVTRASATALQELAGLQKTTIIVPSRALGDQIMNANLYEKADAAVVLTDDDLEKGALVGALRDILSDKKQALSLAKRLHSFAKPRAAKDVASILRRVGQPGKR